MWFALCRVELEDCHEPANYFRKDVHHQHPFISDNVRAVFCATIKKQMQERIHPKNEKDLFWHF